MRCSPRAWLATPEWRCWPTGTPSRPAIPQWFTPDQVHLEPAGAQAMAQLVAADA